MFLLGAVWNPQQKLSNIAFGSKFLIKFLLRDIYLRIWCLCKWKIRHLSFFCIFKCFSSLSSQFLDITASQLKEGVCKKARTSPWDTNEQTLSLSASAPACGRAEVPWCWLSAILWHWSGTGCPGDKPRSLSWHRQCYARLWKRARWRGGERSMMRRRQLTFSPLLLDICWIRQFRGNVRKESCVKFPLSAYSRNTIKTLESGSHGNSMMSEVHLGSAPAHSSATLYTWVKCFLN